MSTCVASLTNDVGVGAWWVDAAGAIFISVAIVARWVDEGREQVWKIVGRTAPAESIEDFEQLAKSHDKRVEVDITRAYYCGARFYVEMEIVLPGDMTVRESHDIALAIQHKIEESDDVERAFVHVDYAVRDGLEHKVERELVTLSPTETRSWFRGPPPSDDTTDGKMNKSGLTVVTAADDVSDNL